MGMFDKEHLDKQHQRKVILRALEYMQSHGMKPTAAEFEKAFNATRNLEGRGRAKFTAEDLTKEEIQGFSDYRSGKKTKQEIQEAVASIATDQRWQTRYTLWLELQLDAQRKRRR